MAIALAVAGGLAAYKIVSGGIKEGKANKEAKALRATRPKDTLNPEIRSNLSLAESELSNNGDLSSWQQINDSQLAESIGAELKGGGTPNDVGSVFAANSEGRLRMLQLKEQLRQQKIANLSNALQTEAADEKSVFDYNSRGWFDDAQANAAKKQSAENELQSGISDIAGAATNFATTKSNQRSNEKTLETQNKMYQENQDRYMQMMQEYMQPSTGGAGGA